MQGCNIVLPRPFKAIKLLGKGAYASAYSALNIENGEIVAVKAIYKKKTTLVGVTKEIEALKTAQKNHSTYIVQFYSSTEDRMNYYLTMEYLSEYVPLSNLILVKNKNAEQDAKNAEQDKEFITQVCAQSIIGLSHIHEAGVAHRDVKPHNIIVSPTGHLKYIDFGLAIVGDADNSRSYGTPLYAAPEIIRLEIGITLHEWQQADFWALGATLFEFATGESFLENYRKHNTELPLLTNLQDVRTYMVKIAQGVKPGRDYTIPQEPAMTKILSALLCADPKQRRAPHLNQAHEIEFQG